MTDLALYPDFYNYSGNSLRKWRRAMARAKTGYTSTRQRIVCAGDSETMGQEPGGYNFTNALGNAWPKHLTDALNNWYPGIAQRDSFWGDGNSGASNFDSRLSVGAGWSNGAGSCVGGAVLYNNTTTNYITFTPANAFDKIRVYGIDGSGYGSFVVEKFGGGAWSAVTTQSQNAGAAARYYEYGVAAGSTAVRVKRSSGSVRIIAIETWDSSSSKLMVCNMGWSGCVASDWSRTTYAQDPANFLTSGNSYIDAQLTLIAFTANDMTQGISPATTQTALEDIIDNAKLSGDALLITPPPIDPAYASATQTQQDNILAAIYAAGAAKDVPIYDVYKRWDSYATSNPLGYYTDVVHPTKMGYADIAQGLAQILLRA